MTDTDDDRVPAPVVAYHPPAPLSPAAEDATAWDTEMAKCQMIADQAGDVIPEAYRGNPGAVMLAKLWGEANGVDLFTTMQEVTPAYGRPNVSSDLRRELSRRAGFELKDVTRKEGLDPKEACIIEVRNLSTGEVDQWREDIADVPDHLFLPRGKSKMESPWVTYTADMLYHFTVRRAHRRLVGGVSALLGVDDIDATIAAAPPAPTIDIDTRPPPPPSPPGSAPDTSAIETSEGTPPAPAQAQPSEAPSAAGEPDWIPEVVTADDLKAAIGRAGCSMPEVKAYLAARFPDTDPPFSTPKRVAASREATVALLIWLAEQSEPNSTNEGNNSE